MILNQEQLNKHNADFINSFIDLKVTGWNTYSKALNAYTFNFFSAKLAETDESVANIGTTLKDMVKDLGKLQNVTK